MGNIKLIFVQNALEFLFYFYVSWKFIMLSFKFAKEEKAIFCYFFLNIF